MKKQLVVLDQVRFEDLDPNIVNVLPGVLEKFNEWYEKGHYIVLTTARPEHLRNAEIVISEANDKGEIVTHWDEIYK